MPLFTLRIRPEGTQSAQKMAVDAPKTESYRARPFRWKSLRRAPLQGDNSKPGQVRACR
jgi:hypothetical protein